MAATASFWVASMCVEVGASLTGGRRCRVAADRMPIAESGRDHARAQQALRPVACLRAAPSSLRSKTLRLSGTGRGTRTAGSHWTAS